MTRRTRLAVLGVLVTVISSCGGYGNGIPGSKPTSTRSPRTPAIHGNLERRELALRKRFSSRANPPVAGVTIWAGHVVNPDDPGVPAVGALLAMSGDGAISVHCTAMLIAPDAVITAAHCFASQLCGGSANTAHNDSFDFVQGLHAKNAAVHDPVIAMTCASADPCQGDLALARLATPLALDTQRYLGIADPDAAASLIKIGYGAYHADGADPEDWVSAGTRSEAAARIAPPPQPGETTFTYSGRNDDQSNVEICGGDSGGPGLQIVGANYRLVGITSESVGASSAPDAADCNPFGTDTRVEAYAGWLKSNLATLPSLVGNQCP